MQFWKKYRYLPVEGIGGGAYFNASSAGSLRVWQHGYTITFFGSVPKTVSTLKNLADAATKTL